MRGHRFDERRLAAGRETGGKRRHGCCELEMVEDVLPGDAVELVSVQRSRRKRVADEGDVETERVRQFARPSDGCGAHVDRRDAGTALREPGREDTCTAADVEHGRVAERLESIEEGARVGLRPRRVLAEAHLERGDVLVPEVFLPGFPHRPGPLDHCSPVPSGRPARRCNSGSGRLTHLPYHHRALSRAEPGERRTRTAM